MVLALSAVHMSGSLDIIRSGVKTQPPARHADQTGSLSPQDATTLRQRALQIIEAWRNAHQPAPYVPTRSELHEMTNFLFGRDIPDGYMPLVLEDMAFDGEDARAFQWKREMSEAGKQSHPVVIIGAGMSGILMGYRLKQAGIPFTIIEKNDSVGGTWYENQYPGLRVDVPSHAYSFSFRQSHRWPNLYSKQAELLAYFRKCAEDFGVLPHVRFRCEVSAAEWVESESIWRIGLTSQNGSKETMQARSLVSAVGFLSRPQVPSFPASTNTGGSHFIRRAGVGTSRSRVSALLSSATPQPASSRSRKLPRSPHTSPSFNAAQAGR